MVTVFADIWCPFTHVGLRRLAQRRAEVASAERFLILAWPLEWVNGTPLDPEFVGQEISALQDAVAPEMFAGFDPGNFPRTTVPALALASLGYATDLVIGESVSFAFRDALFEQGLDIADPAVLHPIASAHDLDLADSDPDAVRAEYEEGQRRGVVGSPYFVIGTGGHFCPTLDIKRVGDHFAIHYDAEAFEDFSTAVFGPEAE